MGVHMYMGICTDLRKSICIGVYVCMHMHMCIDRCTGTNDGSSVVGGKVVGTSVGVTVGSGVGLLQTWISHVHMQAYAPVNIHVYTHDMHAYNVYSISYAHAYHMHACIHMCIYMYRCVCACVPIVQ